MAGWLCPAFVLFAKCWIFSMDSLLCTPAMNDLNIPLDPLGPPSESSHMIFLTLLVMFCLFIFWIHLRRMHFVMTCVKSTLETSSEKSWDLSHNWWMFWFWSIRRGSCTGIYAKRMKKATKCKEHADTGMHHFIIKPSIDILTPQLHHLAEKWWVSRWLSPQRITRRCSRFSWCPDSPLPGLTCGVTRLSTWMTGWPSRTFEENTSRSLVFVP